MHLLADPARLARFWSKVDKSGDCWLWTRSVTNSGYGVHRCGEGGIAYTTMAHRVAWIVTRQAEVPEGMALDHLCRTPACVRPDHLEPVTPSTNVRRSSRYKAGDGATVRRGPITFRERGSSGRVMCIWREYLEGGAVRQASSTHPSREAAEKWASQQSDVRTSKQVRVNAPSAPPAAGPAVSAAV